jgi:hypothetical protein
MTVVSRRILVPLLGKSELALERSKCLAGIITRLGGMVRTARVVSGEDVGSIEVLARFRDFTSASKTNAALAADPEMLKLWQERERDPSATTTGPYVYRTVWGEVSRLPVMLQRQYQVTRLNLKDLIALLPDAHDAVGTQPMVAVIPVFAPEMDRLVVTYYSESMEHLGRNLDQYGMSDGFQAVVQKAARFGAVISGRVLVEI